MSSAVQTSLGKADTALQTETDPTVPAWAKAQNKPTYTAQEVGALPDSTTIPSALSDLTDDATHRTVTDTEKTAWNNKVNRNSPSVIEPLKVMENGEDYWATVTSYDVVVNQKFDGTSTPISLKSLATTVGNKVDKVSGKGLSTNDYTDDEKNKLGGLPTNTELTTALAGKQATLTAGNNINISSNVISANNEGWEHAADQFAVSGTTTYGQKIVSAYSTLDINDVKKGTFRLYNSFAYNADMSTKHFKVEAIYTGGTVTLYDVEVGPYETKELSFTANIDGDCTIRVTNGLSRNSVGFFSENAYKEYTKTLATVGTTGSYNDLSDKPTIPDVTTKADKVNNATNGNFAALDSNGNLTDSGHKHSDYLTQHQDLSNYVQKSQTAGLLKNDGTVDTTQYLSQHQDISGKEDITPIEAVASGTTAITAQVNKYYEVAGTVSSLTVTLPTPTANTEVTMVVVHLTVGANPTILVTSSATVAYSAAYAVVPNKEYELSCLYNGSKWIVSSMEVAV